MRLEYIRQFPKQSLDYLERKVNNGSPSGFTQKSTSDVTNPFKVSKFNIAVLSGADNIVSFGDIPDSIKRVSGVFAHPDWSSFCPPEVKFSTTDIEVVPTSSARTVKLVEDNYYLKLSYPGVIGRLIRELDQRHIQSALQISHIFHQILASSLAPKQFSFLPEDGGVLYQKGNFQTGYVIRNFNPVGANIDQIKFTVPAFSIFATDKECSGDAPLLIQILSKRNDAQSYLSQQIIQPLIDIYFTCVLTQGLSPEMHSQNVLFGFDDDNNVVSIILRDLESVDKDVDLRASLGKEPFVNDYKVIRSSDYNYKIKHSFMYDHKLGEYLVEELITCAESHGYISRESLVDEIRQYVNDKYGDFIKTFFPEDGKWYKFENVEIDRTTSARPYKTMENPILR